MNHRRHESHRGGRGHGQRRARRGIVGEAALLVLADGPLHGYEIINEIEERSEGHWRPSAGSIYPALAKMEERGVVVGNETDDGRRRYELTDAGRDRLADRDPDAPAPWDEHRERPGGELRGLMAEVAGQLRQIGRFGTTEQRTSAVATLERTKAELYSILATEPD